MTLERYQLVMIPTYAPYPRYGRIAEELGDGKVRVTGVHCGDPRCASEHHHGDVVWVAAELEAATAYQPRAPWEHGRKSSPNAVGSVK
jgi:hypothetical protein